MSNITANLSTIDVYLKHARRGAMAFAVIALIVVVSGTALNVPAASAAQAGLGKLYGKGRFQIVSLKVNSLDWACGLYSIPQKPNQWKFVQSRSGLWAEERPEAWVRDATPSQGEQKWSKCMAHMRRGRNASRLYALEDWLALKLLSVPG